MKSKFKLMAAVILVVGITAFFSCEKETNIQEIKKTILLNNKEYGNFHNEILNLYYANKKHTKTLDEKIGLIDSYLTSIE